MDNFTILISKNKIFFEILKEIKLFSKYKIELFDDFNHYSKNKNLKNTLLIFFDNKLNEVNNIPLIFISKNLPNHKAIPGELHEHLRAPFRIIELEKKITSLIAKTNFKKNSFINLNGYIIDKNERKIKKNSLELQLSEKEINFLELFSQNKNPVEKNMVLKKVWKYSEDSETHTVETHIHRLRKKIYEKFGDRHFIKNNNKGYFI